MKKFLLSSFVIVSFIFYSIIHKTNETAILPENSPKNATNPLPTDSTVSNQPTSLPTSIPTQAPTPTSNQMMGGHGMGNQMMGNKYKDGEYTGDIADAYYGNVQVKAVITGGKITDVVFLDYPHDRRTSISINTQAMPYLKSEAIQAQSAIVDTVTGATATSQAFKESLQSALTKAQN